MRLLSFIVISVIGTSGRLIWKEFHDIPSSKEIKIPIQGGLDPKVLLTDTDNLKKQTLKYLEIFKDHPYIFNLGHGVLPETNPEMVDYLVKMVKDY